MILKLLVTLYLSFPIVQQDTIKAKVIHIKDGDSIDVLIDGKEDRVRLSEIDCPEPGQPYNVKAKEFTAKLCAGDTVKIISHGRDLYNRILGDVYVSDTINVNKKLVEVGLAWHYKQYSNNEVLADLEQNAMERKLGLWAEANPTAPWIYRKQKRNKETPRNGTTNN